MIDLDELITEARDRAAYMKLLAKITENSPGASVALEEADRMTRLADALESVTRERDAALARIAELETELAEAWRVAAEQTRLERERAEQAEARIAEAAKLHYRDTPSVGGDWCPEDHHKWPCPTAVSLGLNEGEN